MFFKPSHHALLSLLVGFSFVFQWTLILGVAIAVAEPVLEEFRIPGQEVIAVMSSPLLGHFQVN